MLAIWAQKRHYTSIAAMLGPAATGAAPWVASDISAEVLERHSGAQLRALGVDIKELNVFELHKEAWLTDSPALVICGNIQPPIDHFDYLDVLLQRYAGWRVSAADRRAFYEVMAFEAICGALPLAKGWFGGGMIPRANSSRYFSLLYRLLTYHPLIINYLAWFWVDG